MRVHGCPTSRIPKLTINIVPRICYYLQPPPIELSFGFDSCTPPVSLSPALEIRIIITSAIAEITHTHTHTLVLIII